jgi:hypothetical protein
MRWVVRAFANVGMFSSLIASFNVRKNNFEFDQSSDQEFDQSFDNSANSAFDQNVDSAFGQALSICSRNISHHCCSQNHADPVGKLVPLRPIVVFSSGCSGSTAFLEMLQEISDFSHTPVWDCDGGYELLADVKAGYYGNENRNMTRAVRDLADRANLTGRRLLFKAEQRLAETDPRVMRYLRKIKATVIIFDRQNKLDVALCAVRDCFKHFLKRPIGEHVSRNGEAIEDCAFRRRTGRKAEYDDTKVNISIENLQYNLKVLMNHSAWANTYLKGFGFPNPIMAPY